ncbi:MAG: helix-turn-helix domain-containing protein [Stagnimonas sp.]|nr:helix-turn-helix domain-containing protein [Stagnimonas sp.]
MTPKPGRLVRGSQTGRPVMALLDLIGRRWSLRVLWELREAPSSFRQLQTRCDEVSPSVLNTRLTELREARLVEVSEEGYRLTAQGRSLGAELLKLSAWAEDWAQEISNPEGAPAARPNSVRQTGRAAKA